MNREPDPDVERLIVITNFAELWGCRPSEVLQEDCYHVIGGAMVKDAQARRRKKDAEKTGG